MAVEEIMAEQNKPNIARLVIQLLIVVVIVPLLPMMISGDWGWWQGWVYAGVNILSFIVSRLSLSKSVFIGENFQRQTCGTFYSFYLTAR